MSTSEPRNPFYLLLLAASLLFVATALAYGVVPVLEEKAAEVFRHQFSQCLRLPFHHDHL